MKKYKFEKINNALFEKIEADKLKSIKGGYTIISTCCTSDPWGTTCHDETTDRDTTA